MMGWLQIVWKLGPINNGRTMKINTRGFEYLKGSYLPGLPFYFYGVHVHLGTEILH